MTLQGFLQLKKYFHFYYLFYFCRYKAIQSEHIKISKS